MKWHTGLLIVLSLTFAVLPAYLQSGEPAAQSPATRHAPPATAFKISWKKTVVDKVFRSDGVAVADVNKDSKPDIIIGDVWYEAPDWKMHPLRKERQTNHNVLGHAEAMGVFADDIKGDGYPDVIVIPYPGKTCYWYENPFASRERKRPEDQLWKEHLLATGACNETPIYVDLFKTGKRVLVMGNKGELCYFQPGKDPTQPWERISISGKMAGGAPGSAQNDHGLGCGDVNGDGRDDIITPHGWYEQPAKVDGRPWKFHATKIGGPCANMYVLDVDGDGKADIISSSAHDCGLWWHQQQADGSFLTKDLFPTPSMLAREPDGYKFNKEEKGLFDAVVKFREGQKRSPWRADVKLCEMARQFGPMNTKPTVATILLARGVSIAEVMKPLASASGPDALALSSPNLAVGVGFCQGRYALIVADRGYFALPGQTHALHCVDINGDGLKDLITGRRWWAHGPQRDASPQDPAYLYWFEAKKDRTGKISFTPHLIDDDSGVGTQFAVADINGDGLLDIVVSSRKGVNLFEQVRTPIGTAVPPR